MKTLFNATDLQELNERLLQVTPEAQPQWGTMNAVQMVNHLLNGMYMANGTLKLKRVWLGYLFGHFALNSYINDKPFSKNLPTDSNLLVVDAAELNAAKETLLMVMQEFQKKGEAGVTKHPHPFFGSLEPWQWGRGMWKHTDHHLRQFGV